MFDKPYVIALCELGGDAFLNVVKRDYADNITQQDSRGDTFLHAALIQKNSEVFNYVYDNIPEGNDTFINCINKAGLTPLHLAAHTDNHDALEKLLQAKALDVTIVDNGVKYPSYHVSDKALRQQLYSKELEQCVAKRIKGRLFALCGIIDFVAWYDSKDKAKLSLIFESTRVSDQLCLALCEHVWTSQAVPEQDNNSLYIHVLEQHHTYKLLQKLASCLSIKQSEKAFIYLLDNPRDDLDINVLITHSKLKLSETISTLSKTPLELAIWHDRYFLVNEMKMMLRKQFMQEISEATSIKTLINISKRCNGHSELRRQRGLFYRKTGQSFGRTFSDSYVNKALKLKMLWVYLHLQSNSAVSDEDTQEMESCLAYQRSKFFKNPRGTTSLRIYRDIKPYINEEVSFISLGQWEHKLEVEAVAHDISTNIFKAT